jgi:subfamily B ATP-binding cassette protein MsbA
MKRDIKAMLAFLAPYKKHFIIGQLAMLVGTAAGLAFPWTVREIFDTLFESRGVRWLALALGLLAGVSLVRELANYVKTNALEYVGQRIIRDLRLRIYRKLLALSLGYYDSKSSGEITSSMTNDINLLQQALASGLTYVIQQAVSLVAVVALMLSIDALLTLAVFGTLPLILLVSRRMGQQVKALSKRTQESLGYLTAIVNESISGIDIIQAFVLENYALGMFNEQNDEILEKSLKSVRVSAGARFVIGLLNALFLLVTIGLGGYRVIRGFLSPADLVAFILYSEMIAGPVTVLSGVYIEINRASAAYRRIAAILETESEVQAKQETHQPSKIQGQLVFKDVSFSYDGHQEVLKDITCAIAPGETVALVGPSGTGKSTLVKLIPRFYDPDRGSIFIDGIDTQAMDLKALRSNIAIVPQETYLFGFSIWDNIACGNPNASEAEIVTAAKLANAHEFIMELENGYHTEIGEGGARLSGGQKQRVAIARAFLKDPRILILDEATSALDTHAEVKVQGALENLMQGRTTLIIAHRLSTIQNADRIFVLKEGQILASGTHGELLDTCPFYRDLYAQQFAPAAAGEAVVVPA